MGGAPRRCPRRRSIIVASRGYKKMVKTKCDLSSYVLPKLARAGGDPVLLPCPSFALLFSFFLLHGSRAREEGTRPEAERGRGAGGVDRRVACDRHSHDERIDRERFENQQEINVDNEYRKSLEKQKQTTTAAGTLGSIRKHGFGGRSWLQFYGCLGTAEGLPGRDHAVRTVFGFCYLLVWGILQICPWYRVCDARGRLPCEQSP